MRTVDRLLVAMLVAALLFVGTRLGEAQSAQTVRIFGTTSAGRQLPVLVDATGAIKMAP